MDRQAGAQQLSSGSPQSRNAHTRRKLPRAPQHSKHPIHPLQVPAGHSQNRHNVQDEAHHTHKTIRTLPLPADYAPGQEPRLMTSAPSAEQPDLFAMQDWGAL